MRNIKVAAAQLGPIQRAHTRQAVVARMLDLMRQAENCDLIVYPELALTTFFPRWYWEDRSEADIWFEREMPSAATRPLFEEAKRAAIAMSFGYAERTPDGHHFNTSILVDKKGNIVGPTGNPVVGQQDPSPVNDSCIFARTSLGKGSGEIGLHVLANPFDQRFQG